MEFKTYDNTIVVVGKIYRWSGLCDSGLYTSTRWINTKCRISKIENKNIFIYDYSDMKEYEFTNDSLKLNQVTFKKKI